MTRLVGRKFADDWVADQIEVANGIQHLVLYELIGITQTICVEDAIFIEYDGIFQAAPQGKPVLTQELDFLRKAEGTGPRDIARITLLGKIKAHLLAGTIDGRMIENNGEIELEALIGRQAGNFVAFLDLDRLLDPQKTLGHILFDNAGRLNQEHKGRRGPIQNRHFGRIQIEPDVIDTQPTQGGHQVLDGADTNAIHIETGTHPRVADQQCTCLDVDRGFQIGTPEHDARIRRRRT